MDNGNLSEIFGGQGDSGSSGENVGTTEQSGSSEHISDSGQAQAASTESFEAKPQTAVQATITKPKEVLGLEAANMALRNRAQRAEVELERIRKQLEANQEKPDFWENPEERIADLESRLAHSSQEQAITLKCNLSEEFAKNKYSDWHEKLEVFEQLAVENPSIVAQMRASNNPAEYAYKMASDSIRLREMGDPVAYENKIRQEITAKLQKEFDDKLAAEIAKRDALPGSLASERSSGNNGRPVRQPATFKELFSNR